MEAAKLKNNRTLTILVLLLLVVLPASSSCTPRPETAPGISAELVKLYYGDANNEKMVFEERQVVYQPGEDRYKAVLEELINGPETKEFTANINPNSKVYGTILQNNDLIVSLSEEFNTFAGSMAELMGVGTLVNTLVQFDEVNRIKILVEGEELADPAGEPRGFLGPFPTEP